MTRAARPRIFPEDDRALVWFFRNRFILLEALVREARARRAPAAETHERLARTVRHATRLQGAHLAATLLLAASAIASLSSALLATFSSGFLSEGAARVDAVFARVAAWAGSATLLLLAARLGLDRALGRFEIVATFLAARAAAPDADEPPLSRSG